ncbi:MAG: hypothetical protein JWM88_3165 [Verrucomicrobia bacterium]|nr:hypothetical protein [Verrucomicrobiota bacterium]
MVMTQNPMAQMRRVFAAFVLTFLVGFLPAADLPRKAYNLPADTAEKSLKRLAEQSGREILFPTDAVEGVRTRAVHGEMTPEEALDAMLTGTVLVAVPDSQTGSLTVRRETSVERAEKNGSSRPASDRAARNENGTLRLDTFEVMESKLLNMDKPRSAGGPQPYVVFDRGRIERSGASSVEDFLKNYLPQNTVSVTGANSQPAIGPGSNGNTSQINLRGLGTNQTLILIDGRRTPTLNNGVLTTPLLQPDLNGVPLSAIERIEVLPTTASGIYGGGATGGVINIVLRRDYTGLQTTLTYENTFGTDSAIRRIDISAGTVFNQGRTNVLVAGTWSKQSILALSDRRFTQDYRNRIVANNGGNYLVAYSSAVPPVSSTPNIRSTDGSNLVLRSGQPLGSPITFVPVGYAGPQTDNGAALVGGAGKYNLNWGNGENGSGQMGLMSGPEIKSVIATLRHEISSRLNVFVDVQSSINQSEAPRSLVGAFGFVLPPGIATNPFQQAIRVVTPMRLGEEQKVTNHSNRISGGLIFKMSDSWTAEADFTWTSAWLAYTYGKGSLPGLNAAATNGAFNILRDPTGFPFDPFAFDSTLPTPQRTAKPTRTNGADSTLRLSGPLPYTLPWGSAAVVSGFFEHRDERIGDGSIYSGSVTNIVIFNPSKSQSVDSAYVEFAIPVVVESTGTPFIKSLEFQLAARHDEYTTRGVTGIVINPTPSSIITRTKNRVRSTDPTVALKYVPVAGFALRASIGTGFLPPTVSQIVPSPANALPNPISDPKRGNTETTVAAGQITSGGNSDLKPETSHSVSVGLLLGKEASGLRLSLDYTNIKKDDAILSFPGGAQGIVNNENLFPTRVVRGPNLPGDLAGWSGPITAIDSTYLNVTTAEITAFDIQLGYTRAISATQRVDLSCFATWQTHFKTQSFPGQPNIESVGFGTGNPLKFKANASLTWSSRSWTVVWSTRYFDSYRPYGPTDSPTQIALNIASQGASRVPRQIYHDLGISYRIPNTLFEKQRTLAKLSPFEVTVGLKNVFGQKPTFDATSYAFYSPYGDPRISTYYIAIKNRF